MKTIQIIEAMFDAVGPEIITLILGKLIACCGLDCVTCDATIATITDDDD